MDTIRIAGAQMNELSDELLAPRSTREQATAEIRVLADWELALAGGGDNLPEWL
jgi:hypothetical protein